MLAVDWLRGLAVLVMIQCHAMALLMPELRRTALAELLYRIDGLVAPAFILAAGFSLGLVLVRAAAQGKLRDRVGKSARRIAEVFAVAYAYSVLLLGVIRRPERLLWVDILHCIALALVVCLLVGAALAARPLLLSLAAPALGWLLFAVSPLGEGMKGFWGHLLSTGGPSPFPLLPWLGYALIGLGLGSETARGGVRGLTRACLALLAMGVALALFRRQVVAAYPPHNEWVTSPAEAGVRLAKVMGLTLGLMALERKVPALEKRLPIRVLGFFGTSSLGGYFFHELLLFYPYGLTFAVLFRDSCGWLTYSAFTALLIALTAAAVVGWGRFWDGLLSLRVRGTGPRTTPSTG